MRRSIFVTGFAVGFVLGARAGRERYEQLMRLARKAADSPAVQQAAAAAQEQGAATEEMAAQASELSHTAQRLRALVKGFRV